MAMIHTKSRRRHPWSDILGLQASVRLIVMTKALKKVLAGFKTFQRANRGLYGGQTIKFGDQVSGMGNRTRRTFKPNIQYCSLFSEHMGKKLKVRLAVGVIKMVDEAGGLDAYILNQRVPESWFAEKLKHQILMAKHATELKTKKDSEDFLFNAA